MSMIKRISGKDKKKNTLKLTVLRGFNFVEFKHETACEVTFKKHKHKTTSEKGINPVWSQSWDLGVFEEKDIIEIKCCDDKHEGFASIPLKEYYRLGIGVHKKMYPLLKSIKSGESQGGMIEIEIAIQGATDAQVFRISLDLVIAIQKSKYPDVNVPIFFNKALDYIRRFGITEEGIFRKSGSTEQINWAIEALDKDFDTDILQKVKDPHTIAGILKRFIREIPGSLLTVELGEKFFAVNGKLDFVPQVRSLIQALPLPNACILREMIKLCFDITKIPETKMHSSNLAIVIGPNLWTSISKEGPLFGESKQVIELTEALITKYSEVFDDLDFKKIVTSASTQSINEITSSDGSNEEKKNQRKLK